MNVSVLLDGSISDWKSLLPYYRWNLPPGPWIEIEYYNWDCWYNGGYSFWWHVMQDGECVEMQFEGIDYVCERTTDYRCAGDEIIQLLDGPDGNVIDHEIEFPYFPGNNYTFGGLFPGMTRTDWEDVMNILQ